MAEGIVGMLLEKLTEEVRNRSFSLLETEIGKISEVKEELEKLENKLRSIQPILRDAHTKQFESEEIKKWILRINSVAYDAHDAIDLYRVLTLSKGSKQDDSQQSKVRKILNIFVKNAKKYSLLLELGGKVKEINQRLCLLYKEKDDYGLQPLMELGSGLGHKVVSGIWERPQTTANIIKSNIVGRERDEESLVKWLVREPKESESSVYVAAIVGMGGMGKTTLAKAIYNNVDVKKCFDKRMWICVSDKPRLSNLFKKILEEVGENQQGKSGRLTEPNALSNRIKERLNDKKFLLVLDDVWDCQWWDELRGLWRSSGCRLGTKILVTTRKMEVTREIGTDRCHELKGLNHEQSWQLFVNKALRKGEPVEDLVVVRETGEGIVKKCGGLPLALITIGSMMRRRDRSVPVWRGVLHSPFWSWKGPQGQNELLSSIALSYMDIPFHLKQCLTYCCIFPKDFKMYKDRLLRLWMAEGFIIGSELEGMNMESSAESCLEELVACNLIQKFLLYQEEYYYVLHDMIHDFALYIRSEEHVIVDHHSNLALVSNRVRLCASFNGGGEYRFGLLPEQKLRTLLLDFAFSVTNFVDFKFLRILDMRGADISELSESIGELVLLRYLNLSRTKISYLPKSIIKLHDLQTLDLRGSRVRRLPDKLSCFFIMRHLDLQFASSLEYLPKEIGKLTGLRTLGKFVVGSNNHDGMHNVERGSNLMELHNLNHLRGFLEITHLERVGSMIECQHAQLQKKENLKGLGLSWGRIHIDDSSNEKLSRKMLESKYEGLQPPSSISKITITRYPGTRLPSNWMSDSCRVRFPYLEEVLLFGCQFLEHLPSYEYLPNLKMLQIEDAHCVKVFDTTFDGHDGRVPVFPRLEFLELRDLKVLEEWRFSVSVEKRNSIMPCLRQLSISGCPKLRILPILPTLEVLNLTEMDGLEEWRGMREKASIDPWSYLKSVYIFKCTQLKFLPNGPLLEDLKVEECNELLEIPISSTLRGISVRSCNKARFSWPPSTWSHNLRRLEIENSPNIDVVSVMERVPHMEYLETLFIASFSNLSSFPGVVSSLPRCLKKLVLRDMPNCMESILLPPVATTRTTGRMVIGLQELELGPNLGRWAMAVQRFLKGVAEISKLRRLTLLGFDDDSTLDMLEWFPKMKELECLLVCPQLVDSAVEAITQYNDTHSNKLRRLGISKDLSFVHHLFVDFPSCGTMLTCSVQIDSVETGNMLSGLTRLSNKIGALKIEFSSSSLTDWLSTEIWMQHLNQLRYLKITSSDGLTVLPDWMKNFTKLECLHLVFLPELRVLPQTMEDLLQLEELSIFHCHNLSLLPDWLRNLPRLQKLTIFDCPHLVKRCREEDRHKITNIRVVDLDE